MNLEVFEPIPIEGKIVISIVLLIVVVVAPFSIVADIKSRKQRQGKSQLKEEENQV